MFGRKGRGSSLPVLHHRPDRPGHRRARSPRRTLPVPADWPWAHAILDAFRLAPSKRSPQPAEANQCPEDQRTPRATSAAEKHPAPHRSRGLGTKTAPGGANRYHAAAISQPPGRRRTALTDEIEPSSKPSTPLLGPDITPGLPHDHPPCFCLRVPCQAIMSARAGGWAWRCLASPATCYPRPRH